MPDEFNQEGELILTAVIMLWVFWSRDLWLWTRGNLGICSLLQIAAENCQRVCNPNERYRSRNRRAPFSDCAGLCPTGYRQAAL